MKAYGGGMSHRRHRSGGMGGQVVRGHRTEAARLLSREPKRRAQEMFDSIADLMKRGRGK